MDESSLTAIADRIYPVVEFLEDNKTENIKIKISNLTKTFTIGKNVITAFKDISLEIRDGEFWCFIGPSGCGKTTLLRALAGLEEYTSGTLEINRSNYSNPVNAMVFQGNATFPWMTVYQNVAYGLTNRKVPKSEIKPIVDECIGKMGLSKFADAYPHQLSGGMKQRVGIARAFAYDPEILLMDEPLASLDEQNRFLLQQELLQLWESSGKTVIFVTHSIDEAIFLSDRIMLMSAHPGRIKRIYDVQLPRPRKMDEIRSSRKYAELFGRIWYDLKNEVLFSDIKG